MLIYFIARYFTNIHHYIPVVNKKAFLEEYRGIRPNFPFGILLVSMYLASVNYITICQKFGDADCLNNGKPLNLPKDLQKNLECQFSKYLGKKYEPSLPFVQSHIIYQLLYFGFEKWRKGWIRSFDVIIETLKIRNKTDSFSK